MKTFKRAHTTNTTRVKVVCYYSHRTNGTPYSVYELQRSMNRKAHDIYEFIHTDLKRAQVREDLSIKKALRHIEKHKGNIISALIYVNDFSKNEECLIGKYHRDKGMQFNEPGFSLPDDNGNIFINRLKSLQRDEMRKQTIEYTNIKEVA